MEVKEAYKNWAAQYDTNLNKTRDLEAVSIRETLSEMNFDSCLEIGCGTGKNTEWLIEKANKILAIDLSDEMLSKAKVKIKSNKVVFLQADILNDWEFTHNIQFDLVTFSLGELPHRSQTCSTKQVTSIITNSETPKTKN